MKKFFRKSVFSLIAIYLTSLWNKGFIIENNIIIYLKTAFLIVLIFYLIAPLLKIIFLPLNILTMGLLSSLVNLFLFYFILINFSLVKIVSWKFNGLSLGFINISPLEISFITNILLVSFSISFIVNLLDNLI